MGELYKPMLCQKCEPFSSSDYLFEPKLDGVRCIAYLDKGQVRLVSRTGNDITTLFPELEYNFYPNGILDGEIVVLDANNQPSFNHIQHRLGRTNSLQIRHFQRIYPATFFIFDILEDDGIDVTQIPLLERKTMLVNSAIGQADLLPDSSIRMVPYVVGDGEDLYDTLVNDGWEGVVAKPLNSIYVPDSRSLWKKSKAKREGLFRICGVTRGQGNRDERIGALALGRVTDDNLLSYVGEVGTGLTFDDLNVLPRLLTKGECPFDPVPQVDGLWYWTVPDVFVEVEYLEESPNGRLRFPAVKRIRARRAK